MRLFYFLPLLLIPSLAFAALPDCDESDLIAGTAGCSSLTIDNDMLLAGTGGSPLEITVNGNVFISADIIIDGGNGLTINDSNGAGGQGGPGGLFGGGISITSTEDGQFPPDGGAQGVVDATCSSGGGGGASYLNNGTNGGICSGGTLDSAGGTTQNTFPTPLPFAGGFGGGSGGKWLTGPAVYNLGSGGGGGGGLWIAANGGTITITNGVLISARGGNGGNSLGEGGGGGGGGGGNIYLFSNIAIDNKGIYDVRGGQGGASRPTVPFGGLGGNGGDGRIRLDINGAQTDLSGRQDFSTAIPTSSTSSLKSDISCGTVAKKNENNLALQMAIGFALSILLGFIIRPKAYSR